MGKMTTNKGLSLFEILLSLVVLSALVTIFLPTMQKIQRKKNVEMASLQMNTISNAAIQYYNFYNQWPKSLDALNSLLGYQGSTPNPFCSVWKDKTGCVPYKMLSTFNAHYFALSVAVPNEAIGAQLANNLSTAYWDSATNSVIAYISTFRGFKAPPPTGVLLSATSLQLHGGCTSADSSSAPSSFKGSPSPFKNCVAGSNPPNGPLPYGLINIAQQPDSRIIAGNNYGSTNGFHSSSFNLTDFACPAGTWPTMLFLPVGLLEAVATSSGAPTITASLFTYSQAHFITQTGSGNINYESCVSGGLGTSNPSSTTGAANRYNGNFFASFGDVLCLPDSARQRWPDGLNVGSCSANQP